MGTKKYSCPKCGYLTSHLRRHIEVNHKDVSPHVVEQLLDACGMRRRPRKISAPAPPALHATVGDTHAAPVTAPEVSYIHHTGYQLFNEAGGPIPMHIHNSYSSLPGSRKPCLSLPCTLWSETPMRRPAQANYPSCIWRTAGTAGEPLKTIFGPILAKGRATSSRTHGYLIPIPLQYSDTSTSENK